MIDKKDITFVVQGPVSTGEFSTKESLQSIREYFPSSQIILSTWEGSNIDNLPFDEVLLSKAPGAPHSIPLQDRPNYHINNK